VREKLLREKKSQKFLSFENYFSNVTEIKFVIRFFLLFILCVFYLLYLKCLCLTSSGKSRVELIIIFF